MRKDVHGRPILICDSVLKAARPALLSGGNIVMLVWVGVSIGVFVVVRSVIVIVTMTVAMIVAMTAENQETDEIGGETAAADDENQLGIGDLLGLNKTGQGLENDRDAEGDEEDGVEEGTEDLGADEAVRVLVGGFFFSNAHSPQTDDEGDDIVQHVECVGHKGEGVDHKTGDQFDEEKGDIDG